MPENATVGVLDSGNVQQASSAAQTVYGGDVYSVAQGSGTARAASVK